MASNLNVVVLIGRVTRDAELKYTNSGTAVTKFSLAVNRRRKTGDQWVEEANFFDITLWGRMAESLTQYLIKGKEVAIEGELRQNKWEQDGQPRSKVEITANNIQLLGGGRSGGGGIRSDSMGGQDGGSPSGGSDDFEDDIPF